MSTSHGTAPVLKAWQLRESFKDLLVENVWPYIMCYHEMWIKPLPKTEPTFFLACRRGIDKSSQTPFICQGLWSEEKKSYVKTKTKWGGSTFLHWPQDSTVLYWEINMKLVADWYKALGVLPQNNTINQPSGHTSQTYEHWRLLHNKIVQRTWRNNTLWLGVL